MIPFLPQALHLLVDLQGLAGHQVFQQALVVAHFLPADHLLGQGIQLSALPAGELALQLSLPNGDAVLAIDPLHHLFPD
ncbi:hypothetical protein D9M69_582550 [compost metagenome]